MQINRPDINDYIREDGYFDRVMKERYMNNLNSYIDYLERCLEEKNKFIDELISDKGDTKDETI